MRSTRRSVRASVGAGLGMLLVVALGAVAVRLIADRIVLRESCVASVGEVQTRIGVEEAERVSTIAAAVAQRGLSVAEATSALAAAFQESELPDLDEPQARALASALSGESAAAFSCSLRPDSPATEAAGTAGLTPRAAGALRAVEAAFGDQRAGGFDPRGVRSGHVNGSAHYAGRAVDLFYRPTGVHNRRVGWASAHWLVANAARLDLATVIYDGRIWTARRSGQGWREYTPPNGNTANPTLMHRDHVHLDVP